VDNLPPELLPQLIELENMRAGSTNRLLAVAVDARSGDSLPHLLPALDDAKDHGTIVRALFLDASDAALVRRFSETRRPHPMLQPQHHTPLPMALLQSEDQEIQALVEVIAKERELLAPLRDRSAVIDTSLLRPAQLRGVILKTVQAEAASLTVVFESFAYKHGVPLDADFVFDARMLPNPHYIKELRPLTGRDQPVMDYLKAQPEATELLDQIETFIKRWLPALASDQRSYVTVAVGCTGGQHRSVYCVEQLRNRFTGQHVVLARHREQDGR
jgi:UPF0042 nucleotide-binding protein